MFSSYEDNYSVLNKLFKKEQNTLLINRLKNTKSKINTKPPYSFNNTRNKKTKSHEQRDPSK